MPKYVLVLGAEAKVDEGAISNVSSKWLRLSQPNIVVLDSPLDINTLGEHLFPNLSQATSENEEPFVHLLFQLRRGSLIGFHDESLWEFVGE